MEDALQRRQVAPEAFAIVNAELPVRTWGTELLLRYRRGGLMLMASHTYTSSNEEDPEAPGARRDVPLTPGHVASLNAIWEDEERGRIGIEAYYIGRQPTDENPFRTQGRAYVLFGALAERRFGRARVFLNLENLGNVRQTRFDPLLLPGPRRGRPLHRGRLGPARRLRRERRRARGVLTIGLSCGGPSADRGQGGTMKRGEILSAVRRDNRTSVVAALVLTAILGAVLLLNWKYLYNWARGPFAFDAALAAAPGHREFVRAEGPLLPTGLVQETTFRLFRGAVENKSVSATYMAMLTAERILVVKVPPEFSGRVVLGRLVALPEAVRAQLPSDSAGASGAPGRGFYPYLLEQRGYGLLDANIFVIVAVPLFVLSLPLLAWVAWKSARVERHDSMKRLARLGPLASVVGRVEAALVAAGRCGPGRAAVDHSRLARRPASHAARLPGGRSRRGRAGDERVQVRRTSRNQAHAPLLGARRNARGHAGGVGLRGASGAREGCPGHAVGRRGGRRALRKTLEPGPRGVCTRGRRASPGPEAGRRSAGRAIAVRVGSIDRRASAGLLLCLCVAGAVRLTGLS